MIDTRIALFATVDSFNERVLLWTSAVKVAELLVLCSCPIDTDKKGDAVFGGLAEWSGAHTIKRRPPPPD